MEFKTNNIKLQELLDKANCGVISTTVDSKVFSSVVYFASDNELNIFFNTRKNSTKYKNILKNPNVSFVIFGETPATTLQIRGTAKIVHDISTLLSIYKTLIEKTVSSGHIPPISDLDASVMVAIKIKPTWARFGDFTHDKELNSVYEMIIEEK